ncbi:hypothetical protein ACFVTC_21635 [Streptomyces sp. NPDC057950]
MSDDSPATSPDLTEVEQVFNRRRRGGRHWFSHGCNWRGMTA